MQTVTQIIPKSQLDLVNKSIEFYLEFSDDCEKNYQELSELQQLGLYEVSVTLTKEQYDNFSNFHGIEFPDYRKRQKLEELVEEYGQKVVDQVIFDIRNVGYDSASEAYRILKRYRHAACLIVINKEKLN